MTLIRNTTKKNTFTNETFSCAKKKKKVSITDSSEVTLKQLLQIVVKKKLWNSEFAEKFHDSDGCALSKDEGSNYNGYDSPNC